MAHYIGLMSGTSMDGIDAALVEFEGERITLVATHSHPLSPRLHRRLLEFCSDTPHPISQLGKLDIELGRLFGEAAKQLIAQSQIQAEEIKAIGSHGQTIFHAPQGDTPFSYQIGDPNTIAQLTGITTVADFRRRDMAAGGQGAPLVPAFHEALFRSCEHDRAIINIGGIANITLLPKQATLAIRGYDTGPGNALLDAWCMRHQGQPLDLDGQWAGRGEVDEALLTRLLNDPYFSAPPPKSTGKEYFNLDWLKNRLGGERPEDVQRTLLQLTVETIAREVEKAAPSPQELYICGGGAHNLLLMQELQHRLAGRIVTTTEKIGLAPDWVEATAFAWLAKQTLEHQPTNLPAVTGARQRVILGGIYLA